MEGKKEGKISYFKQRDRLRENFLIHRDIIFTKSVSSLAVSKIRTDIGESEAGERAKTPRKCNRAKLTYGAEMATSSVRV